MALADPSSLVVERVSFGLTDTADYRVRGRLLGIDHGSTVIGIAISDPTQRLARPLQLLKRTTRPADFGTLNALIAAHHAIGIVVGLPETPPAFTGVSQADTVQRWAARCAGLVAVPVYLWNETLSTDDAERWVAASGRSRPDRVDHIAAAMILQSFLDEHPPGTPYPTPVKPGHHAGRQ
ncbi:MAG: Holliday junction resolvase RuvX [Aggregatilineales bacterium]